MEKILADEAQAAPLFQVMFPESGIYSVPFSYSSHVRYRPQDLQCNERQTSSRTGEFKQRLLALWWLNDEKAVPYVFRVADGTPRSMDAGCLGMLTLKATPELNFELNASGYIIAVSPTPAVVNAWIEHKDLLLKKVTPPA